ncbi:MAG: phosphatidylglycerol lysyltransferase domain-containing protein [Candidatus Xenobia bacterium]
MSLSEEQEVVLRLLRRYGWNTTSFQVLEPGYCYWISPDGDAAVAYVDTGAFWLGAGAPVCDEERLAEIAYAFRRDAEAAGRKVAFFGAGSRLVSALCPEVDALQVGVEACWDPREWTERLGSSSQVASQVRRAKRKGVSVERVPVEQLAEGSQMRQSAEMLAGHWLKGQAMAPLGFLAYLDLFSRAHERRYYKAERNGQLIGLLVMVPIFARNGWFLEDLLYDPKCPPGTTETLIDAAMRDLEQEAVAYASMGMVALAGLPEDPFRRPEHPRLYTMLRFCSNSLNWLYGFRGLQAFRAKFKPLVWEPVYLVGFERINLYTIFHVLKAFAGGRLDRFAAETAAKGITRLPPPAWAAVPTLLAILLVPWIGLLLWCDSTRWFGTEWLARAWALFDVPVAAGFVTLGWGLRHDKPWVRPLDTVLLGVVLADSWLALLQALLFNLPHAQHWWDRAVSCLAVLGPFSAAVFLFLLMTYGPPYTGRGTRQSDRT